MAEITNTGFPGSALPAALSSDHRTGASHAVAGGELTLTATGAVGSQAIVRQTAGVAAADADTVTFHVISADAFRLMLCMRTAAGDATFLPGISNNGGGEYYSAYYRQTGGFGGLRQLGPSISSRPFLRFRRSGLTSMVVETAATYGGSYTVFDTFLESDGLWTAVWTAAQAEMGTVGGAGVVVISALGDGTDAGGGLSDSTRRRRRRMSSAAFTY